MPGSSPLILALDIGTSSVRSAVFDARARPRRGSKAAQSYRVRHSADRAAELDAGTLLRASKHCLGQTSRYLTKSKPGAIAGSCFWHSLLGLDRTGAPLTPVYTWADARCAPDAARLREQFDERTVQKRTGCMLRASFWPAKLAWLRRTQPKLFRRVSRWVSPAEWIFEEIFGARGCSYSMASGTGLYDLSRRAWDEELTGHFGLTNEHLGSLGDKVAANRLTVFPAIGDGAAGNLGSGATQPRLVALNVGTSAAVRSITPCKTTGFPFGLFQYAVDHERTLLGGAVSNAGNLRAWMLRVLRLPQGERAIEKLLRQGGRKADCLTVLPFWVEERAPTWPENLGSAVLGLNQSTTADDLLVAALDAVFGRLGEILERLEEATGRAKRIIVSGGIEQSPASLQLLANSLGRDLEVCADREASLRGAAVHALEQLGYEAPPPKFREQNGHDPAKARQARARRARQNSLEKLLLSWEV
jgi:gluconokinase